MRKAYSIFVLLIALTLIPSVKTNGWNPICVLKTQVDGVGYVPNLPDMNTLKIDLWTNDTLLDGDHTDGVSPYESCPWWPDGEVDIMDINLAGSISGINEGDVGWKYMADCCVDRLGDIMDVLYVATDFGHSGSHYPDLEGVTISFDGGDPISPDVNGYITIPEGATNWVAKKDSNTISAVVTFYEEELEVGQDLTFSFYETVSPADSSFVWKEKSFYFNETVALSDSNFVWKEKLFTFAETISFYPSLSMNKELLLVFLESIQATSKLFAPSKLNIPVLFVGACIVLGLIAFVLYLSRKKGG